MSNELSGRIFHIMQYLHDVNGNELISEAVIKLAIETHNQIEFYAYALHDKDVKLDGSMNPMVDEKGNQIPVAPHYHIIIKLKGPALLSNVAKWFGVADQYVELNKIKGARAFAVNCAYLIHFNKPYKYQYDVSEVKANFDYSEMIERHKMAELKKNLGANARKIRDEIRYEVLHNGMTLNEACEKNRLNYTLDFTYLKRCRNEYLSNAPIPTKRLNYYIHGKAGGGKDLCSVALARALFPNIKCDDDLFFQVGANGALFENYGGQPVIIWGDCRADDLLKRLGGRGNVFNIFDTFPNKIGRQNVKYGSVRLINSVNIVNSVQPFKEFYLSLAGEYTYDGILHKAEDVVQASRRFPFFISLHLEDFDVYMNHGFIDLVMGDYESFVLFNRVRGSFQKLHALYGDNVEKIKITENKMLDSVAKKSHELLEQKTNVNDDEIASYGEIIECESETINFGEQRKLKYEQEELNYDNPFI